MIAIPTIPQYILESSVCLFLFFTFYWFALRNQKHFQLNRFYLLSTSAASVLIPLLNFKSKNSVDGSSYFESSIFPILSQAQNYQEEVINSVNTPGALNISLGDVITVIYYLGMFLLGIKLLISLFKIFDLIQKSQQSNLGSTPILETSDEIPASSFFGYIFYNRDHDEQTAKIIVDHELVHVRQKHSLDVILMELMVMLKWFNPLIYLFRNHLRKTHEYIADAYVSDEVVKSRKTYAEVLISHGTNRHTPSMTNTFSSFTKDRLAMLGMKNNSSMTLAKIACSLILTLGLTTLFSFDFSDRIPGVKAQMSLVDHAVGEITDQTVFSLPSKIQEGYSILEWGDHVNLYFNTTNKMDFTLYIMKENLFTLAGLPHIYTSKQPSPCEITKIEHLRKEQSMMSYDWPKFQKVIEQGTHGFTIGDRLNITVTNKALNRDIKLDMIISNEQSVKIKPHHHSTFIWGKFNNGFGYREEFKELMSLSYSSYTREEFLEILDSEPEYYSKNYKESHVEFTLKYTSSCDQLVSYIDYNDGFDLYELENFKSDVLTCDEGRVQIEKLISNPDDVPGSTALSISSDPRDRFFASRSMFSSVMSNRFLGNKPPQGTITLAGKEIEIYKSFSEKLTSDFIHIEKADILKYLSAPLEFDLFPADTVSSQKYKTNIVVDRALLRGVLAEESEIIDHIKESYGISELYDKIEIKVNHNEISDLKYPAETIEKEAISAKELKKWVNSLSDSDMVHLEVISSTNSDMDIYLTFVIGSSSKPKEDNNIQQLLKWDISPKEESNYQMYETALGPTIIKVDINDPANEAIVNAFSNNSQYKIIHIPGFSTMHRVIKDPMSDFGQFNFTLANPKDPISHLNAHLYKELVVLTKDIAFLKWGNMISMNEVGKYSYEEYKRSYDQTPQLILNGEKKYEIERFDLVIVDPDQEVSFIRSPSIESLELLIALQKVEPESTIYFDNMIVSHKSERMHLMKSFKFSFE